VAGRPKFRKDMELLEELPSDMIVSMFEAGKSQTMICYELGIGRRALEQWIEDADLCIHYYISKPIPYFVTFFEVTSYKRGFLEVVCVLFNAL